MSARLVRLFISYAHADRDVVDLLRDHLGGLENDERIEIFDDRQLIAGQDWDARLKDELARADLVLFVVTAKFLRSSYCAKVELKETIRQREEEGIVVMPIIAETCLWTTLPLARLQALPKDANVQLKPLNKWGADTDVALTQIAEQVLINLNRLAVADEGEDERSHGRPTSAPRGWRQPEPPDRCLGRADDLAVLVAALIAAPPKPIVVFGAAGMGKSTLTREAAAAPTVLGMYGDRRAWVELDKVTEPAALKAALADALGLPAERDPWLGIEAALRQAPALLLLDNLETPWEQQETNVEKLLADLAGIPGLALVASIRGGRTPARPAWGTRLEAHRLDAPHDRDLLLAIAGDVPSSDPLLADLLRALEGWPLAIELFAAQAGGLGGLDLTWRRWQAERTAMLDRSGAEPDRLSSLAVSLGFSLASPLMKLRPPHPEDAPARLYAMLGRLPDGMAIADAEALLPRAGHAAVGCLIQNRLAHRDGQRIRMLAPVREHAGQIELNDLDRMELHNLYLGLASELFHHFHGSDRTVDLSRLRAELVNIRAILPRNEYDLLFSDALLVGARARGQFADAGSKVFAEVDRWLERGKAFLDATYRERGLPVPNDTSIGSEKDTLHEDALQAFTESKTIAERRAAADPGNAEWQRDHIAALCDLAEFLEQKPDRAAEAAIHWSEALAVARTLAATGRLAPTDADLVATLDQRLAAAQATDPPP